MKLAGSHMSPMRNSRTLDPSKANFADRMNNSAAAKKALLDKFRAASTTGNPELAAKRAEREAVVRAREERQAEREAAKRVLEAERAAAEARRLAELEAEKAAQAAEAALAEERRIALLAEQKAARDLRYANRKKRK
jgi:hypothetical protein